MNINIIDALTWVMIFIVSATVHEAAHAWAAKRGGDLTAYLGGQVSLDPVPHIKREPLGMVVFPLVSSLALGWPFGFASAPYDARWAYNHPRKAAWMAAAGPAANLLIVVICVTVIKAGILAGFFLQPDSVNFRHVVEGTQGASVGLSSLLSMVFTLNLIMVALNLLPLPPLDGSSIIMLFLNENSARAYKTVTSNPMFSFIGLFLAWQVFSPLFDFIFLIVINIVYWGSHYA